MPSVRPFSRASSYITDKSPSGKLMAQIYISSAQCSQTIILVSTTLATVPASVANSATDRVNLVFVTFAARKCKFMAAFVAFMGFFLNKLYQLFSDNS